MAEVKPGYKTTEFYLTFLAMLLGGFMASGIAPDTSPTMKMAGLALSGLTALGYGGFRWGVKASAAQAAASTPAPVAIDAVKPGA